MGSGILAALSETARGGLSLLSAGLFCLLFGLVFRLMAEPAKPRRGGTENMRWAYWKAGRMLFWFAVALAPLGAVVTLVGLIV